MRTPRQWFFLEDVITGESRDIVTNAGGTEQEARDMLGGSWTDPHRVICYGPSPLNVSD
jgi:hypothetical protein